jgi:thymidylate synthase ThyX
MLCYIILFENDENLLDSDDQYINSIPDDVRIESPNVRDLKKGVLSSLLNKQVSISELENSTAEIDESTPNALRMTHILEYWEKLLFQNKNNSEEFTRKGNTEQQFLLDTYIGKRMVRRDKLGRAFEFIDYTFDVESSFRINRELNRHRIINKINNKVVTARNSYESFIFPNEVMQNQELFIKYKALLDKSFKLYRKVIDRTKDYYTAQYVLPLSVKTRQIMKINARQIDHLLGLRTTPQTHDEFRLVAQQIFTLIESVHPNISRFFKFCDMIDNYPLGRLKQELSTSRKINDLASLEK